MKKKLITVLLITIWMILIYSLSNMDSYHSNKISKKSISKAIEITEKNTSKETQYKKVKTLNYPIRKITHMFLYFILSILIISLLSNIQNNKYLSIIITLGICLIYASLDEYHQTFIVGRTGQIKDVIIDMIGSIIGCFLYRIYTKKRVIECQKNKM